VQPYRGGITFCVRSVPALDFAVPDRDKGLDLRGGARNGIDLFILPGFAVARAVPAMCKPAGSACRAETHPIAARRVLRHL